MVIIRFIFDFRVFFNLGAKLQQIFEIHKDFSKKMQIHLYFVLQSLVICTIVRPFVCFFYFFLKNGQIRHGNSVFIAHKSTPASAALTEPKRTTAHAPRTPTSAIGTFGVIVTNR